MGHFFAASAFRNAPVAALASSIAKYAEAHGVSADVAASGDPNESTDALLYAPVGGWTCVLWPVYFNIHDVRACAAVSRELQTVAVTVNVYDGDFWSFEVLSAGTLVDKSAPRADYFAEDDASGEALKARWCGRPAAAAETLSVQPESIEPYYRFIGPDDTPGKAYDDDQSPLEDFWVFVDMWRRIGIQYPAQQAAFASRVRLAKNFTRKLPTWEGEDL